MTLPLTSLSADAATGPLCPTGDCADAPVSLMGLSTGFTPSNIFGFLLVYGLGLILAASLLNYRRRIGLGLVGGMPAPEPVEETRARRDASDKYIYPYPTAEKAAVLRCLAGVVADHGGRFRVTNRADMARLARRPGVSDSDWYRAMAAYHMTRTDFSVLNAAGKAIAAVEYVETATDPADARIDRLRRETLAAAGLPILVASRRTTEAEIDNWLRPVLRAHSGRA